MGTITHENVTTIGIRRRYELRQNKVNEFLSLKPHKFMTVKAHSFFECPIRGDEEGLIMRTPGNQLFVTDLYDLDREELEDVIENGKFAEYYSTWTR